MIYRWVVNLVRNTHTSIRGQDAPSYRTIEQLWHMTIKYLTFMHRDLKQHYVEQDVLKIKIYLDQQVTLGMFLSSLGDLILSKSSSRHTLTMA